MRYGFWAALLFSVTLAQVVGAQTPARAAPTAQTHFKAADGFASSGHAPLAIAALREGLALAPTDADARLRLARLLLEQNRYPEALPESRAALQLRPDPQTYAVLLGALRVAGSPIELAMTAEESLQRFPDQVVLLWPAIEALLAVRAPQRAISYWQMLPESEQDSPRGQWLQGAILEAEGKPAQAYRAYGAAAATLPQARSAQEKLAARSVALDGQRYFPPSGWSVLPGTPVQLFQSHNGMRVTLAFKRGTTPRDAVRQLLESRLPIAADVLAALLAPAGVKADPARPASLRIDWLACADGATLLCLEATPDKETPGLFPTLHVAAVGLDSGSLVLVLEAADRNPALAALKVLAGAGAVGEGSRP